MILAFTVPVKPVGVNKRLRNISLKTPEAIAYFNAVAAYGHVARKRAGWETYDGPVDVVITYYFQSERPDSDGPDKPTLDALQESNPKVRRVGAGIIRNDKQVYDRIHRRRVDPARPRVEIIIGPAGTVFSATIAASGGSR